MYIQIFLRFRSVEEKPGRLVVDNSVGGIRECSRGTAFENGVVCVHMNVDEHRMPSTESTARPSGIGCSVHIVYDSQNKTSRRPMVYHIPHT